MPTVEPAETVPAEIALPPKWPASLPIDALRLKPKIDWAAGFHGWRPGESGAAERLDAFLGSALPSYADGRDRPDQEDTSRLSPHLHFGEISVRQIWHAAQRALPENAAAAQAFLRQIAWREFSYQLMFHFPHTPHDPLRPEFRFFPSRTDGKGLEAWTCGKTGYPLVDAGMRELWHTGWMHNRVRMVAASFLVKHLLIPWQEGAAWFWDTLVDADLADAAPYFRIFNPVRQGEKFDPEGAYVRRWVPELAKLPAPWIHQPWKAPPLVLAQSGIQLGKDYPLPVVDHDVARKRALAAFAAMKAGAKPRSS